MAKYTLFVCRVPDNMDYAIIWNLEQAFAERQYPIDVIEDGDLPERQFQVGVFMPGWEDTARTFLHFYGCELVEREEIDLNQL